MKKLMVLLSFAPLTALACPDLSGTYNCKDDSGDNLVALELKKDGETFVYVWNGDELRVDGQTVQLPDEEGFRNGHLTPTCSATALNLSVVGQLYNEGKYFADVDAVTSYSLDASGNLLQQTKGALRREGQQDYPIEGSATCAKL